MNDMSIQDLVVEIRREFPHPRARVFQAWLERDHLLKWMGPTQEIYLEVAEVDAREGGKYRFGFGGPEGTIDYVHGTFEIIRPPEKLVFTWMWEEPLPDANIETLVTVDFTETSAGTEIHLIHKRFVGEEMCTRHNQGWRGTLDKLETMLEKPE